jgi:ferredoxin
LADKSAKWPHNVTGQFYVDDQCIACDACVFEAPGFFAMNDEDGHAFVAKQPTTDAEVTKCQDALDACPVEAIGNDGA